MIQKLFSKLEPFFFVRFGQPRLFFAFVWMKTLFLEGSLDGSATYVDSLRLEPLDNLPRSCFSFVFCCVDNLLLDGGCDFNGPARSFLGKDSTFIFTIEPCTPFFHSADATSSRFRDCGMTPVLLQEMSYFRTNTLAFGQACRTEYLFVSQLDKATRSRITFLRHELLLLPGKMRK